MVYSDGVGGHSWTPWIAGTRSYGTVSRCLHVVSCPGHTDTLPLREIRTARFFLAFLLDEVKDALRDGMSWFCLPHIQFEVGT